MNSIILFSQIPGGETAIAAAAQSGRWEAVVLVVVMLVCVGFLVYIVKAVMAQAVSREAALTLRIDKLEDFINKSLMTALESSTKAMMSISITTGENGKALVSLIDTLHTTRTCFATGEHQSKLINDISDKVANAIERRFNLHSIEKL